MASIQDCASAPYTNSTDNFPSPDINYQGIMDYFEQEFGFTPLEVKAKQTLHCWD